MGLKVSCSSNKDVFSCALRLSAGYKHTVIFPFPFPNFSAPVKLRWDLPNCPACATASQDTDGWRGHKRFSSYWTWRKDFDKAPTWCNIISGDCRSRTPQGAELGCVTPTYLFMRNAKNAPLYLARSRRGTWRKGEIILLFAQTSLFIFPCLQEPLRSLRNAMSAPSAGDMATGQVGRVAYWENLPDITAHTRYADRNADMQSSPKLQGEGRKMNIYEILPADITSVKRTEIISGFDPCLCF